MMTRQILLAMILIISLLAGCARNTSSSYDQNDEQLQGQPSFPPLADSWVIDTTGLVSKEASHSGDAICQKLKTDGVAEMVVVVIKGVTKPEEWATHYGRWLKLGKTGPSTVGGNNGIIWLIRPDATDRMTVSVGRGLPRFTSADYGKIMDDAEVRDCLAFNNYSRAVLLIVSKSDKALRELYGK